MTPHPPRVLLAEDEPVLAVLIQDMLDGQGLQITHCSDGKQAWEHLKNGAPDYDVEYQGNSNAVRVAVRRGMT